MSDDSVQARPERGGYRPGGGQKPGPKQEKVPGVRSLFGTDKAPLNEEGQQWRADNLAIVEKWAKEKNPITTALDNLLRMNDSPSSQRTILEFMLGRPVSQSEIMQETRQTPDDSAAAMNAVIDAMKQGMIANGVDPAFADRIVETSLWGDGHEEAEEGDEEVFGAAT